MVARTVSFPPASVLPETPHSLLSMKITYVAIRYPDGDTVCGQLSPRPGLSMAETVEAVSPGAVLLYSGPSWSDARRAAEQHDS